MANASHASRLAIREFEQTFRKASARNRDAHWPGPAKTDGIFERLTEFDGARGAFGW